MLIILKNIPHTVHLTEGQRANCPLKGGRGFNTQAHNLLTFAGTSHQTLNGSC